MRRRAGTGRSAAEGGPHREDDGSLNAPITNFVGVLSATLRSLVYAIEAVRKQKGGEE